MGDSQVFEENFTISGVNSEKYDRVSRITGSSADSTLTMTLDVNHELFPCQVGDTIQLVLATTLSLDGNAKEDTGTSWRNVGRQGHASLADMYDYVCYGRHYKLEDGEAGSETVKYYTSFGGLLLYMEGPYKKLGGLKIDNVYMLIKRT